MKFCHVFPTAYPLSCVKGETNTFFFHMPLSPAAVVPETVIVFVYYLLLGPHHVPGIVFKQWHRKGENERELQCQSHPQGVESPSFRVGMD